MQPTTNQYLPQIAFHPGETLEEKLQEMGMGPKEFAIRTDKPEKTIIAILKGKSSITPEMAVQFEHVLNIPAHFWLNIQKTYDEFLARQERNEILNESIEWARQFPLSEMIKKGWLPDKKAILEKTSSLLSFFGMSNHHAWEEFYFNQELKIAFRISLAHTKDPHAISAWLRKGELQAAELKAKPYDSKQFNLALMDIKSLMAHQPHDFLEKLQTICLEAGVKVVPTPCLPKAPSCGATRWLGEVPIIQLSDRYKRNDSFWFTFFHEAGHILLHGKKEIFLEKIEYVGKDLDKEEEANEFARDWTLSEEEEEIILENPVLNEEVILKYAKEFNTHPAIIIGRLQYDKLIPYSVGREFFEPIEFN